MAKFIAVAQLKGGVGKSTVSTNLAGALARDFNVALVDADLPQGTATYWSQLRDQTAFACQSLQLISVTSVTELAREAERLDELFDVVVIDLPPRGQKYLREVMPYCDLMLMPLTASPADVWAAEQLADLVRETRKTTKRLKARLIWNRLRSSRATEQFLEQAAADLRAKELESRLGQRAAYVDALGRGLTVLEGNDSKARAELEALVADIKAQLKLG